MRNYYSLVHFHYKTFTLTCSFEHVLQCKYEVAFFWLSLSWMCVSGEVNYCFVELRNFPIATLADDITLLFSWSIRLHRQKWLDLIVRTIENVFIDLQFHHSLTVRCNEYRIHSFRFSPSVTTDIEHVTLHNLL